MLNQKLLDYIKQQLQQGISKEQIKNSLTSSGWEEQDVDEAFSFISNPVSQSSSVPLPTQGVSFLPGAVAILGQAWTVYKQRLGTFLGITIIPTLTVLAMVVVGAAFVGGKFPSIGLFFLKFRIGGSGLTIFSSILFSVLIILIQSWESIALLYAIKDNQEKIGIVESYRRGWHQILSYLWVSSLVGFVILGGSFLLFFPGIIFAVWFSLAVFILIAEGLKGMDALLKSREYVRGNWSGVAWRFFFIGAMSLIIYLVIVLIFALLRVPFRQGISRLIFGLFLSPLIMTYAFLIYKNLKSLKGEIVFKSTKKEKIAFIVPAILGILIIPTTLFLIVFFSLGLAKKKARDSVRQINISQIRVGIEIYRNEHNNYPASLDELSPKYLLTLPVDPLTKKPYQYQLKENGKGYKICTWLESTKTQKCLTVP